MRWEPRRIFNMFKNGAGRATPQRAASEETRRLILDTALALFRERGFEETTIRDIASRAGLSLGAAYYYFKSKEAIVGAYYEYVQQEHQARAHEAFGRGENLRDRLRAALHTKIDIVQQDRRLLRALFRYGGDPGHPLSWFGPSTREQRQRRGRGLNRDSEEGRTMARDALMKAVLVAALAGTAVLIEPWPRGWFVPGLLLFGLFNAIVSPSGTLGVRLMAIGATLAALWSRGGLAVLVGLLAWLVWPPAYAVAWALARERSLNPDADQEDAATAWRARIGVAALIGAVAVGVVTYRLIALQGLKQTAALFVGIPALVAITVVFAVSPRSATGVACKAVTIGLLVSLLFLGEGMVCVMMSAPLFYAIAVA